MKNRDSQVFIFVKYIYCHYCFIPTCLQPRINEMSHINKNTAAKLCGNSCLPMLTFQSGCHVIVIPWFVRLNEEIIHELYRVDYLSYRRINYGITLYATLISLLIPKYSVHKLAFCGKGYISIKTLSITVNGSIFNGVDR